MQRVISDVDGICALDAPYAIFMPASRLMGKDKKGGPFVSQNCVLRCDTKLRMVIRRNLQYDFVLQISLLTDRYNHTCLYDISNFTRNVSYFLLKQVLIEMIEFFKLRDVKSFSRTKHASKTQIEKTYLGTISTQFI